MSEDRVVFIGIARVTDGALLASIFADSKMSAQEKQQLERQFLLCCQGLGGQVNPNYRDKIIMEYRHC